MIKTNGYEFKRFYNDDSAWPKDAWHEDQTLIVNGDEWTQGVPEIPDTAVVNLIGGVVYGLPNGSVVSMETHFRNWRKRQNTSRIVVEYDTSKHDEVIAAVKAAGGRVK